MLLDTTTRKLQLVLTAAMTTANMPVSVYYVDSSASALPVSGMTPTNSNGVTYVDILAAPAASTQRKVNAFTVTNTDTAAKTVHIYLDDNGTDYLLCAATLQVGDVLGYTDTTGWYTQDSAGSRKTTVGLTSSAVITALGYTPEDVANKSTDVTLAANSDTLYASQKAVKTYVDNKTVTATNVSVTQRTIGNSTNLDTALGNLDDSQGAQKDSGFESWTGAGNYYSIATNQLTLLRGGVGYIKGKKVTWSAPQTTAVLTSNAAHWIYIDTNGTIGIATTRTEALYQDNIILFEAHHDGTDIEVVIENHLVSFDTGSAHQLHELFGTVLTPVAGTNIIGADVTRVATGTGGVAGDRQIKIVGTANINDQGLSTNIPDSAGAAISWKIYYKNASGAWTEYATQTQLPMFYNNAGTPTALATSGSTDVGVFVAYAVKAEPNSGLPIYILVMNDGVYGTDAAAITAITDGSIEIADGTLFQALEPCQLGYVIVTNNVSGGYISTLRISKYVGAASISGGAGTSSASSVPTNTIDFKGTLSVTDSNVQVALNSVDKLERIAADLVAAATTDLSTMTGNFGRITGNTGITSFGTHAAGHLVHLLFTGTPLITHSATLDIPGGANLQIAVGDRMILRSLGDGTFTAGTSGNYWQIVTHIPSSITGTGSTVKNTAPVFVTPALGTPASGDLRNCSLAVAPAIGGTTPSTGAFTALSASSGATITGTTKSFDGTNGGIHIFGDASRGYVSSINQAESAYRDLRLIGTTGQYIEVTATSINTSVGLAVTGTISATSIQNTPIGSTTPAAGAFTTLSATGDVSVNVLGVGAVNIGHTTNYGSIASGGFGAALYFNGATRGGTGYTANGAAVIATDDVVYFTNAAVNATRAQISSSGLSATSIQNTPVGSVTPSTGAFTTLSASGNITFGSGGIATLSSNAANYLFLNAPTGYGVYSTINGVTVSAVTDVGLAVTGAISATGEITGSSFTTSGFGGSSVPSANKYLLQAEGASTFRSYMAGADASSYGIWSHYAVNSTATTSLVFTASKDLFAVAGAISATTSILSSGATSGIGYTTGAGGTVTQITSRTTGVTINKINGEITLVSAAGSASWQSFTVTNSAMAATDHVVVNQKSGTDKHLIHVTAKAAGSFEVTFATTGGTTTEQPVFGFEIHKGSAA